MELCRKVCFRFLKVATMLNSIPGVKWEYPLERIPIYCTHIESQLGEIDFLLNIYIYFLNKLKKEIQPFV